MKLGRPQLILLGVALTGPLLAQGPATSSADPVVLAHTIRTLHLGDEKVWVHSYERAGSGLTFVNLHDNENTAAQAAKAFLREHGGRLVELQHGRGREVVVRLAGTLYRFDPNRMFSEHGLRKSMKYYHSLNQETFATASHFVQEIIQLIDIRSGQTVIAVHNNTEGKLTIRDYMQGQLYGRDTQRVHLEPAQDPDDYFFVSSPVHFQALARTGNNVALRSEAPPDRGTLGGYACAQGADYILVEAQHGHLKEQVEMLELLGTLLLGKSFDSD